MSSEPIAPNWWETFFSGIWIDLQRDGVSPNTAAEIDLIERLLRLPPGAELLDIPCGPCRHALDLAERGYNMTGVDITRPLLDAAKHQAAARGVSLDLHHRDMRDIDWQEQFDGAYCFWGSFGYFDDAGNSAFIESIARALKPGGRFLLETLVTETLLPHFQERGWRRVGEAVMLEERRYDHVTGRIDAEWTFIRGGESIVQKSSIRVYSYRELELILQAAGLAECEAYDSRGGAPFSLGADRLCMVATKR